MILNFLRHASVYFGSNMINKVFTFAFWAYLARILSIEEMGQWALFNLFLTVIGFVMCLEIQSGFSRYYLEFKDDINKSNFQFTSYVFLLCYNIFWAILIFLTKSFLEMLFFPIPNDVFITIIITPFFSSSSIIYLSRLRLENRSITVLIISTFQTFLYIGISLFMINLGYNKLFSIFFGSLLQSVFVFIVSLFNIEWKHIKLDSIYSNKSIVFSILLLPSSLGAYISSLSGKYILGKFVNAVSVGIFEAYSKITLLITTIMDSLYMSTVPTIYNNYKNETFKHKYVQLITINFTVLLIFAVVFSSFSKEFVALIAGNKYVSFSNLMAPFIASVILFYMLRIFAINIHLAQKTQFVMIPELISGAINIALTIIWALHYGIQGAVFAAVISNFIRLMLYCYLAKKLFKSLFVGYKYILIFLFLCGIILFSNYLTYKLSIIHRITLMVIEIIPIIVFMNKFIQLKNIFTLIKIT